MRSPANPWSLAMVGSWSESSSERTSWHNSGSPECMDMLLQTEGSALWRSCCKQSLASGSPKATAQAKTSRVSQLCPAVLSAKQRSSSPPESHLSISTDAKHSQPLQNARPAILWMIPLLDAIARGRSRQLIVSALGLRHGEERHKPRQCPIITARPQRRVHHCYL